MKAAVLVLDLETFMWVVPEAAYRIKTGFDDGYFTPVKFF